MYATHTSSVIRQLHIATNNNASKNITSSFRKVKTNKTHQNYWFAFHCYYRTAWNADAVERWENCPPVCPSVCQTRGMWQNKKRSVQIFIPYERSFSLVFWEEWLVRGNPFYLKFCINQPHWSDIAHFQPIFARSASAVTHSEIPWERVPYLSALEEWSRQGTIQI